MSNKLSRDDMYHECVAEEQKGFYDEKRTNVRRRR